LLDSLLDPFDLSFVWYFDGGFENLSLVRPEIIHPFFIRLVCLSSYYYLQR